MEQITFSYEFVVGVCTFLVSILGAWYANKGQIKILEMRMATLEKELVVLSTSLTTFENKWGNTAEVLANNSIKALHEIEKINMYIQGVESKMNMNLANIIERVHILEKGNK